MMSTKVPKPVRSMKVQGLSIVIETDTGQSRYWSDPNSGEKGETKMVYPYGYIVGVDGVDGDELDVFVGPKPESNRVFVITQARKPEFKQVDEQKVMLGFNDPVTAKTAYLQHYNDAQFFISMTELSINEFKEKIKSTSGYLIKSGLINICMSAKLLDNMLYVDLNKAFKPVAIKPMSEVSSKTTYTTKSKDDKEEDLMSESVEKSFAVVDDILKALRAVAVASIARRSKVDSLPPAPIPNNAFSVELLVDPTQSSFRTSSEVSLTPVHQNSRHLYVAPQTCSEPVVKATVYPSQEAQPYYKRGY